LRRIVEKHVQKAIIFQWKGAYTNLRTFSGNQMNAEAAGCYGPRALCHSCANDFQERSSSFGLSRMQKRDFRIVNLLTARVK
jgi:hypothetical protein